MSSAACAPCRERRLRCDRKIPHCSNCARGQRSCPGYKQCLSWPKPNNKKRSLVGPEPRKSTASRVHTGKIHPSRWTNVSVQDIGAHHFLSTGDSIQEDRSKLMDSPLSFTVELSWTPTRLNESHYTLLQYFQLLAASAITCDVVSPVMLGIIMRLAFLDDSASSQAVLYATLAMSSLLRHGPSLETIKLHGATLRALEQSAKAGISSSNVVQHVTAGMLLCSFEIHGSFRASGPWFLYVKGAKQLVRAVNLDRHIVSSEFIGTTNWLYHHDVCAQFGLRHWRRKEKIQVTENAENAANSQQAVVRDNTKAMTAIVQKISKMTGSPISTHIILWPLADVFQNIVDSSHPQYHSVKYRKELESLEHELESILNGKHVSDTDRIDFSILKSSNHREVAILELYRLAALIYLERASRNFSGTSPKLNAWASAAFDLIIVLGYCRHGFPVFIIACEARTDEQRIIILDCLDKTQGRQPTAGMKILKDMAQSAWALDDLETNGEVDYMAKMDVVVSGCETMPSFA